MTIAGVVKGVADLVRKQGAGGIWHAVTRRLPFWVRVRDRFLWLEATPGASTPRYELPPGMVLTRGQVEDLPLLRELGGAFDRAAEFLAAGHTWWLVRDGERPVFSTWTFAGIAPFDGARHGWISLPPGTVNNDDSVTAAERRGEGIYAAAITAIFDELARDGVERVVVGVQAANTSSRRALAKITWRDFAVVDIAKDGLVRRGREWRDRIDPYTPLIINHTVVRAPAPGAPLSPQAEELRAWLADAVLGNVQGPRPS